MMNDELYRLVYCSRSRIPAAAAREEMLGILATARRNNPRFGVTGALLFSDGCFAQVLEGSLPSVERIFECIQRDRRHAGVTVLQVERCAVRSFGEWSMAFAGGPSASHPLASMSLDRVLAAPPAHAASDVLATLSELLQADSIPAL